LVARAGPLVVVTRVDAMVLICGECRPVVAIVREQPLSAIGTVCGH
jgi:hypothetical protein